MAEKKFLGEYLDLVAKALLDFQYIELALKLYIVETYAIISSRVKEIVPFKYGWKDVENESLGRLLDRFSKISSDRQLIKDLRPLQKERNRLAQQAYVLMLEEQSDSDQLEKGCASYKAKIQDKTVSYANAQSVWKDATYSKVHSRSTLTKRCTRLPTAYAPPSLPLRQQVSASVRRDTRCHRGIFKGC